jgi:hypothetical protein
LYADIENRAGRVWGPVGRFGWKHRSRLGAQSPFTALRAEAASQRDNWPPIRGGLFGGEYARFEKIADRFDKELLQQLPWF